MLNCVEIAISGFLCIYWVYGRRLWELMIDCWKRKKALELNFAQFFGLKTGGHFFFIACTIDVAIVCWYNGKRHSEDRKTCTSKQIKIWNQGTLLGGGDSYHWQKADAGAVLLPYCEFFESVRSFGDFEEWKCFFFVLKFCNLIWNLGHSWICNLINEKMSVIYVDIHNEVIWSNHFRILDKRSNGLTVISPDNQ